MNTKPVPATSPLGGQVEKGVKGGKGGGREYTKAPKGGGGGVGKVGEQGVGGQRKGYGERTGVQVGGKPKGGKVQPLPKPPVNKKGKGDVGRLYTSNPRAA